MVITKGIIDGKGFLQLDKAIPSGGSSAVKVAKGIISKKEADYVAFSTESFYTDGSGFANIYRGSPEISEINGEILLEAARLSAKYLSRVIDSKGRFTYLYDPIKDTPLKGYNILRHAGTLYSMLEYYQNTQDPQILRGAEKALGYLVSQVKRVEKNGIEIACVVENNEIKLGGNGLGALAIAKYIEVTGDREYLPLLLQLGEWMLSVQDETGNFVVHKQRFLDGEVSDFRSVYYPGEAIFGLMRIHALDPDPKWHSAASSAANYLISVRDKGKKDDDLYHDHWLLYGLNELYRVRNEPAFLEHALRIARAIIRAQNNNSRFPDWDGGFFSNPRSTPAATRMEGLGAAYRLARFAKKDHQAKEILASLRSGAKFLLRTQIGPSWAMYMPNPRKALGGVRKGLSDFGVRIDYVQHSLSAFLAIAYFIDN